MQKVSRQFQDLKSKQIQIFLPFHTWKLLTIQISRQF